MNRRLGHAKRGSHTTLCMPHCKHYYLITPGHIVDVIASSLELSRTRRVSGTGDCRYRRPMCGACPRMSHVAASSLMNRSGEAVRFRRHQFSISRICASASGVVRTGRLTAAGAVRREFAWQAGHRLPRRISRTSTTLRARRAAHR
jgi:hypothetical protein